MIFCSNFSHKMLVKLFPPSRNLRSLWIEFKFDNFGRSLLGTPSKNYHRDTVKVGHLYLMHLIRRSLWQSQLAHLTLSECDAKTNFQGFNFRPKNLQNKIAISAIFLQAFLNLLNRIEFFCLCGFVTSLFEGKAIINHVRVQIKPP